MSAGAIVALRARLASIRASLEELNQDVSALGDSLYERGHAGWNSLAAANDALCTAMVEVEAADVELSETGAAL